MNQGMYKLLYISIDYLELTRVYTCCVHEYRLPGDEPGFVKALVHDYRLLGVNQGMCMLLYMKIDYLEMDQGMYKLLYMNIDYWR